MSHIKNQLVSLNDCMNDFHDVPKFLTVAISICECLIRHYEMAPIHGHLSPYSIFIHQKSNEVSLADKKERSNAQNAYLSPEQTKRIQHVVDSRSDVYSLGLIFYKLLTKNDPVSDYKISVNSDFSDNLWVPSTIVIMIQKMLFTYPNDRYQSIEGLLFDLNQAQSQWNKTNTINFLCQD